MILQHSVKGEKDIRYISGTLHAIPSHYLLDTSNDFAACI